MSPAGIVSRNVRDHYERHPYPDFPLLASVRTADTYALNLRTLWARFNGDRLESGKILLAGCGSFSPYPFAVANPGMAITALDLSQRNLDRARLHCLLHRRLRVDFMQGDLLDRAAAAGRYHFIDCFGVLHHLADPAAGLAALEARLAEGGILRLMVYGKQARREAQAIRTALRMLKISDIETLKKLLRRARPGGRLLEFLECSSEAAFDSGLADALLHPAARTFTIDELLALVATSSLTPLLFTHHGALPDVADEIDRLRTLERNQEADINFILYLALHPRGAATPVDTTVIFLNPALGDAVRPFKMGTVTVPARLGRKNPPLDRTARSFLRSFSNGRTWGSLAPDERRAAMPFLEALFLAAYTP